MLVTHGNLRVEGAMLPPPPVNTEKKSSECREWEGGWKAGGGGEVGDRFVHLLHFASLFNPSYTF